VLCEVLYILWDGSAACTRYDPIRTRRRTQGFGERLLGRRRVRSGQEHRERDHRARFDRCVAWLDFDACARPSRRVGSILSSSREVRKKASLAYTPADGIIEHQQHTYIHRHTHAHTRTQVTSETHAHAHAAIVYHDSLLLTSSMHETKEKGHRAHGQNKTPHAYGPKSTPIAQGLVITGLRVRFNGGSRASPHPGSRRHPGTAPGTERWRIFRPAHTSCNARGAWY